MEFNYSLLLPIAGRGDPLEYATLNTLYSELYNLIVYKFTLSDPNIIKVADDKIKYIAELITKKLQIGVS